MRQRIVALYIVLAVLATSLVAYVTYRYSSIEYIKEIEAGLKHEAILIEHMIKINNSVDVNDSFLHALSESLIYQDNESNQLIEPRRITIINTAGKVIADSKADSKLMENHSDRNEFTNAIKNGLGIEIRKSETTNSDFIYVAYFSSYLDFVIRVSGPVQQINDIRNTILIYSVISVLGAIFISALIALSLSRYVVKPIARLVKEYSGSIGAKRNSEKKDEINQLSLTLSSLTENIENTIKELQDRNARVNNIINNMDNGLIAVDRSMSIIMMNPVITKLFGADEGVGLAGKPLVQTIRNRQMSELLLKAVVENRSIDDEILLYQNGKRILSVHAVPIYNSDNHKRNIGALAYINDITQIRKLEDMRSEFVSNVTHELKTPLTSIQGFVETLKNGAISDPAVSEKFLDIIDIEADRLYTLINDILALSEIENIKHDNEKVIFGMRELAEEVSSMLENSAREKNITFNILIDQDVVIEANRNRIKQLLINLMDNAIKYNIYGGSVLVFTQRIENRIEIHVKDTGIGVPDQHKDRIFERFYRVDKGRSRELGGTGLGLSIVKHIAQLYGGYVRVESQESIGSDFVVTLPAGKEGNPNEILD